MLSFYLGSRNRRDFLRVGGLTLGGLSLANWLPLQAALPAKLVRDKSVIFLFLHGGPSQIETFDPKMTAPAGIRSVTGETPTTIPGVTFGGSFPKTARWAKQLAVVRSFQTGNDSHDIKPIVCKESAGANIGSLYARIAGTNHPELGIPRNIAIFPRAIEAEAGPAQEGFGKFWSTGALGSSYAPFIPGGGGPAQDDLELKLDPRRFEDRRALLTQLDAIRRGFEHGERFASLHKFQQQALQTLLAGVSQAFDWKREDPRVIARYDTAPLVRPDQISRKWNNYPHYVDNAKTLGRLLLLARRLCEAGCGFVTVTTNFVWDMHADINNATIEEGMDYVGRPLDHALNAFMEDVTERGLSDKILLVVAGEMGRSPRVNAKGGRDHWGNLAPLVLAGGGLNMGQVIGQSTSDAGAPRSQPYTNAHLISTILHTLVDVGQARLLTGLPTEVQRVLQASPPIDGLL